jgi:integrase
VKTRRRRRQQWRGSVYPNSHGHLCLRIKVAGTWKTRSTGLLDTPENRLKAAAHLAVVTGQLQARESVLSADDTTDDLTVAKFARSWAAKRKGADGKNDDTKLTLHILPILGTMELISVRPKHVFSVLEAARARKLSSRYVRNIYSVMRSLFRDATFQELLPPGFNPCTLTAKQLGKAKDKVPGWRDTAVFSRAELEQLLWNEAIPLPRRIFYALAGVGCLRTGEAAGLRWGRVDLGFDTLGRISVLTSYDNGQTKTDTARHMPVHPAVKSLLAEWKLSGWARTFGRKPEPGDLVVPTPPEPHRKGRAREVGSMLDDGWVWKRLQKDIEVLGFPHRRVHDLRRTGITLYREDGADERMLSRGTHAAPRDVMGMYTSVAWRTLCREISKLRLGGRAANSAVSLLPGTKTPRDSGDVSVEAAGIEPASGSLQPTDPTCVVRVPCVGPRPNTDNLARPQPGKSRRTPPRRRGSASPHSDGSSPAHGPRPGEPRTRTV